MPASRIIVSYTAGGAAKRVRVVLGFHGLLRGMSKTCYTNSQGVAVIEHSGKGRADVYVGGKKYHSFLTPGTTAVTI